MAHRCISAWTSVDLASLKRLSSSQSQKESSSLKRLGSSLNRKEPSGCVTSEGVSQSQPQVEAWTVEAWTFGDDACSQTCTETAFPDDSLCPWLAASSSMKERAYRVAALRTACDRLLKVREPCRPRSLEAFAAFLRRAVKVRAYIVRPTHLLRHLKGVSAEAAEILQQRDFCPPWLGKLVEPLSEARAKAVRVSWDNLPLASMTPSTQARWIESAAFEEHTYSAEDIASALCALGLVALSDTRLDCSGRLFSIERCAAVLPEASYLPTEPSFGDEDLLPMDKVRVVVPLPKICRTHLLGRKGQNIKALVQKLKEYVAEVPLMVSPRVLIEMSPRQEDIAMGWVAFEVSWRDVQVTAGRTSVKACIDRCIRDGIVGLYAQVLRDHATFCERRLERQVVAVAPTYGFGMPLAEKEAVKGGRPKKTRGKVAACRRVERKRVPRRGQRVGYGGRGRGEREAALLKECSSL